MNNNLIHSLYCLAIDSSGQPVLEFEERFKEILAIPYTDENTINLVERIKHYIEIFRNFGEEYYHQFLVIFLLEIREYFDEGYISN